MDIVEFAKTILGKHLFEYEIKKLRKYEELMEWSTFNEWIKPVDFERQYLFNIWTNYQIYKETHIAA